MEIKTYGLVGKSGTGKSYQAMNVCRQRNISCIIDDGLLIHENNIAAGISAKRQDTMVGAIKTALFQKDSHRDSVMEQLAAIRPEAILILGTSENMITKIAARLELPPIQEWIDIEEITTEQEREIARKQRKELGKHVIPVPTFQIKREFSGYFLDPLRIFRGFDRKASYSEKSVVRPTFSYLGRYVISDKVISDIVNGVAREVRGVEEITKVLPTTGDHGVSLRIQTNLEFGTSIFDVARTLQSEVLEKIEHMTAFHVSSVDVEVKALKRHKGDSKEEYGTTHPEGDPGF